MYDKPVQIDLLVLVSSRHLGRIEAKKIRKLLNVYASRFKNAGIRWWFIWSDGFPTARIVLQYYRNNHLLVEGLRSVLGLIESLEDLKFKVTAMRNEVDILLELLERGLEQEIELVGALRQKKATR